MKGETSSIWHDNQNGIGDLYTITGENYPWGQRYQFLWELTRYSEWDDEILNKILPTGYASYTVANVKATMEEKGTDIPIWMLDRRG